MRVIAGQWRGRRLRAPDGQDVRPTTDRAKEAVFKALGRALKEACEKDPRVKGIPSTKGKI